MPVTPVGPLSLAIENLRQLVAHSASFQAWTGSADAAAALARVYHTALPRPADGVRYSLAELQALRPFALCDMNRSDGFARTRVAETAYEDSGRLLLSVEADIDPAAANDYAALEEDFMNHLAALLDDMAAVSGQPGFLTIHSFRVEGPQRADVRERDTNGDYHVATVTIEWGN